MALPYGWLVSLNRDAFRFQAPKDDPVAYGRWEYAEGRRVWERFFKSMVDLSGKDVLDLGCGPGGKTCFYASLGLHKIVGLDNSATVVGEGELCKNSLASPNDRIRIEFVASDAAHTPFPDEYFDVVTCSDAMEHFDDPAGVMREMVRVLKPGGIITIDFAQWGSYNGHHLGDFFKTWWVHVFWAKKDIDRAVRTIAGKYTEKLSDEKERELVNDLVSRRLRHFSNSLNHLSIGGFEKIISNMSSLSVVWKKRTSAHPVLWPLIFVPGLRELSTARNVYILRKTR